jgi:propionyl-CoA carboxylase beta chain
MTAQPVDSTVPDPHTTAGKLADLERRYDEAVHAGSARAVEKQHAKGKKTARERIAALLDEGSFIELDEFARHRSTNFGMEANRPFGDGVVTGYGTIDGRPVCVFSQDVTVFGGALGEVYGEKIVKVLDFAMKNGCPVVGINEGGGARIQEGVVSLGLYGEIFYRNVQASGVIPQISLIMGAAAGGHVYSPALTDFVVMVDKTSQMFITGPDVVRTVTGEDVTLEELGGARTHNTLSGNAHYLGQDEDDAINYVKALLSYLPSNNLDPLPIYDTEVSSTVDDGDAFLDTFIPDSANQPYDMHDIIEHLLDDGDFLEVQALFAPNILIGFGRVEGHPVGIVANQPLHFAGCLITIVTRKAFGGAYDVMGSKHLGADVNVAWPTAQIAVMGAQGAANILYRRDIAAADDPEALRAQVVTDYEDTLVNPYIAAERGYIDSVIPPSMTRSYVIKSLRMLRNKRQTLPPKKHGNIPL